jgi:hypothetical protein
VNVKVRSLGVGIVNFQDDRSWRFYGIVVVYYGSIKRELKIRFIYECHGIKE